MTLLSAAVIPLMFLFSAISHDLPDEEKSFRDPLNAIFNLSFEINGMTIFPLFVVLICTLLPQIEYRNNAWKQVLTSPQTKTNVFLSKLLNMHLLLLLFLAAFHLYMWIVAVVAHFTIPELNVLNRPLDGFALLKKHFNIYISMLALSSLQFWIGMRSKNFIAPIAIGVALWLVGVIAVMEYHSDSANYYPYSFLILGSFDEFKVYHTQVKWTSLTYAFAFLFIGFLDFRRRRMNG